MTVICVVHVVLYKRDTNAAVSWVGVIVLFPFVGSILYVLFGINRIKRRATSVRNKLGHVYVGLHQTLGAIDTLDSHLPEDLRHFSMLDRAVNHITARPLLSGNSIMPLVDGDVAYPEMIKAIAGAKRSVCLQTYIFSNDATGLKFVNALKDAKDRGVEVRVLIDAIGLRYSFPSIMGLLLKAGLECSAFQSSLVPWKTPYVNLRNHRKILIVDGEYGFTGGMNISSGNELKTNPSFAISDLHFKVRGPVVCHLMDAFAEDWVFATGKILGGKEWFPAIEPVGDAFARGITDGPDADMEKQLAVILSAIGCAKKSIKIVTPYFLPESPLINALKVAVLRGVNIEIIVPERNNLRVVGWASTAQQLHVLRTGCHIYHAGAPFDHTKLMIVDDYWATVGSANWDPRSLRLNFEFNIEFYSQNAVGRLCAVFADKLKNSTPYTLSTALGHSLPVKIRNGIARLCTPYL